MAHSEQSRFVESVRDRFPDQFRGSSVIEIGSLDINGSVRTLFDDCDYIGVDLAEGPGVDLVSLGHDIPFTANSFDVAISCECFEHDPHWKDTFDTMCKVARTLVVVTVASHGRPEHGTSRTTPADSPFTAFTWDHYRNLGLKDFMKLNLDGLFSEYQFSFSTTTNDLYFWGILRGDVSASSERSTAITNHHEPRVMPVEQDCQWRDHIANFVDRSWYLRENPDVAQAGVDPIDHFITHGLTENRNPNRFFDAHHYMTSNPDVLASGRPAFGHFIEHGRFESRSCHPKIDIEWCSRNMSITGHGDYFSWVLDECVNNGKFPFDPSKEYFAPRPMSETTTIADYILDLERIRHAFLIA